MLWALAEAQRQQRCGVGEGQAEGPGKDVPHAPAAALPAVVAVRRWHTSLMPACIGLTW